MVLNCRVEWSACIDRKQTRTCTDTANCAKTPTRTEELYCAMDTTPPGNVVSFVCSGSSSFVPSETITCTWTNPEDIDFKESIVYVNNVFMATISKEQEQKYQITGITTNVPNTYNIKVYTKDTTGNINDTEIGNKKSCSIQLNPDKTKLKAFCQ